MNPSRPRPPRSKKEPNATDRHVGARVRMRRMMIAMSQEKLAEGLGITFQQIQKYEKGTNRIGASRLQQIADVLGVPPAFFFEGLPANGAGANGATPGYVNEFLATGEGIAIARDFVAIRDRRVRSAIAGIVASIVQAQQHAEQRP